MHSVTSQTLEMLQLLDQSVRAFPDPPPLLQRMGLFIASGSSAAALALLRATWASCNGLFPAYSGWRVTLFSFASLETIDRIFWTQRVSVAARISIEAGFVDCASFASTVSVAKAFARQPASLGKALVQFC